MHYYGGNCPIWGKNETLLTARTSLAPINFCSKKKILCYFSMGGEDTLASSSCSWNVTIKLIKNVFLFKKKNNIFFFRVGQTSRVCASASSAIPPPRSSSSSSSSRVVNKCGAVTQKRQTPAGGDRPKPARAASHSRSALITHSLRDTAVTTLQVCAGPTLRPPHSHRSRFTPATRDMSRIVAFMLPEVALMANFEHLSQRSFATTCLLRQTINN